MCILPPPLHPIVDIGAWCIRNVCCVELKLRDMHTSQVTRSEKRDLNVLIHYNAVCMQIPRNCVHKISCKAML